jgi:L-fuconolactonase
MRLDTHQHFWKLCNAFSDWPNSDLLPIYRDFEPADLGDHLSKCGIDGTILVQAAPSIEETEYCLGLADRHRFIKGVVGWLDFEAPTVLSRLDSLANHPKLKGLRPMVQSIAEPGWLLKEQFTEIFEAMIRYGLVLDGLVLPHQIVDLVELVRRHPELPVVLDHGGKPSIRKREFGIWSHDIARLAEFPNAYCKLSGLWTEAAADHSQAALQPWVNHLLRSFGTERLMWGSDWPVVELKGSYCDWFIQCRNILSGLTEDQQRAVFGGNGRRFYGID